MHCVSNVQAGTLLVPGTYLCIARHPLAPPVAPIPAPAPVIRSQTAGGMGTPRGGGKSFPRPNIPPQRTPPGSVNSLGANPGSAPLAAQSLRGVSTVQPGQTLSLKKTAAQIAEERRLAFSGIPGDANDPDLGQGGILPGKRVRVKTARQLSSERQEADRQAKAEANKKKAGERADKKRLALITPTAGSPSLRGASSPRARATPPISSKDAAAVNKSNWKRKPSGKDKGSLAKRIGKSLFGSKARPYTKLKK